MRGDVMRHRQAAAMPAQQGNDMPPILGDNQHRRLSLLLPQHRRKSANDDAGGAERDNRAAAQKQGRQTFHNAGEMPMRFAHPPGKPMQFGALPQRKQTPRRGCAAFGHGDQSGRGGGVQDASLRKPPASPSRYTTITEK